MTEVPQKVLLRAQNISKQFGGLQAVNDVSINLVHGQIHAVIGPNGAGKSTLTHLLCGELPLTSGKLQLCNTDITGWSAARVARWGLGRSFQKTNVFLPLSVLKNVQLAAHFNLAKTQEALALAKLEHRAQTIAGKLSHGEQRQLEIALSLAGNPSVLLLDEPLAGMGADEARRMIELLNCLKAKHAILLIEHDMDAVFSLADTLTVMVDGRVIATGTPNAIRANSAVQAAYLGEADE